MAKVTGPLFSLDASGKFGDSLVFSNWKGINTVRQYTRPGQANTVRQQAVKEAFRKASGLYRLLLGPDKEAWKLRASGQPMSGYNLFMGVAVQDLIQLRAFTLINKVQVASISGNAAEIKLTASESGEAIIQYGNKPGTYYDQIAVMLEKDTEITAFLPNLVEGNDYYFRIVQEGVYLEPPANLTVSPQGNTGNTEYAYRVTALSKAGETLPSEEVLISDGAAVLSESDYNLISWDPVPGAIQYAVYRTGSSGSPAGTGRIAVVSTTEFSDTGLPAQGELPAENTAMDRRGESGDYHFSLI